VLLKIAIKELLMGKLETFFKDKLGLMFDSENVITSKHGGI